MDKLVPITSVLAKYAVGIAAAVIAAVTAFVVWIALGYFLREFPHPMHLSRTEEHDEFELRIRGAKRDNEEAGCLVSGLLPFLGFGLFDFIRQRVEAMPLPAQRVICGVVFIITLSTLLFCLKIKGLRYYALLEIMFGLASSIATLYTLQDQIHLPDAAVLGTAIYLLIRGLDNFKKDLDERKKSNVLPVPVAPASTGQSQPEG